MLEDLDSVQWDTLYRGSQIPQLLHALDQATDNESFVKHYRKLMDTINHQGDIYDSTAPVVPFIIRMLTQSTDSFRIIHHLIILADLLRHTSHHTYHQPSFPESIVPQRWSLNVYDAVKAGIDHYQKLLSHADEAIRAGSVYVLSFLVDEYQRILPALRQTMDKASNVWLSAGAIYGYARVACFELAMMRDSVTVTSRTGEHLKILDRWSQDTDDAAAIAAALGYISVLASNWSSRNAETPDHIVGLVRRAIAADEKPTAQLSDKLASHISYVYNEITPFNDALSPVIRWCQQADVPQRWASLLTNLLLPPVTAHELVREMLDGYLRRLPEHRKWHHWNNHSSIRQSDDSIIYTINDFNKPSTSWEKLNDNQRIVLGITCNCDPFWEMPTNLLSFYYGLPDERDSLRTLTT
ncbi:MAG: hypothetical protein L0154_16445 [Chloroflexi bacterium]|nr:hypothetical protein [Chloroflexota bacterium]